MTGKLLIMDARKGHETVLYAREGEEVKAGGITQEEANARFQALIGANFTAFSAEAGQTGTQVREFDPTAEELLFIPPMVGG